MMQFIDRKNEMDTLEQAYNQKESALVILYGRRRIGKTELLKEFIKNKKALYYLATVEAESLNRGAFKNMAADFLGNELMKSATVDRWETIFQTIAQASSNERTVIVIDEFQYLGKVNPAFPSVFQRVWDTILKPQNVMVVLCGSLISMMVSQTLSYESPLYGRRTGQIRLKQIPFSYYHEFFEGKTDQELVELYSVTGGVPKYIELFEGGKDIYAAIERNILNQNSFLYDEPNFLLQSEVSEVGSYFSIIRAVAFGNHKQSKIAGTLEIKQTSLNKYLRTLIDLDILEREVPITEENPEKSKRGLYKIKDNFIWFWFRFVHPNLSYIESGHPEVAMRKIRSNFIDSHASFVYEDVCREKMWLLGAQDTWPFTFSKVGRWWDNKGTEIDIVALDPDGGNIVFGECKYWKGKVGINVLQDLEAKTLLVNWRWGNRQEHYILFSAEGFTEELLDLANVRDDVRLFSCLDAPDSQTKRGRKNSGAD